MITKMSSANTNMRREGLKGLIDIIVDIVSDSKVDHTTEEGERIYEVVDTFFYLANYYTDIHTNTEVITKLSKHMTRLEQISRTQSKPKMRRLLYSVVVKMLNEIVTISKDFIHFTNIPKYHTDGSIVDSGSVLDTFDMILTMVFKVPHIDGEWVGLLIDKKYIGSANILNNKQLYDNIITCKHISEDNIEVFKANINVDSLVNKLWSSILRTI